jgi:hypothetical protein
LSSSYQQALRAQTFPLARSLIINRAFRVLCQGLSFLGKSLSGPIYLTPATLLGYVRPRIKSGAGSAMAGYGLPADCRPIAGNP